MAAAAGGGAGGRAHPPHHARERRPGASRRRDGARDRTRCALQVSQEDMILPWLAVLCSGKGRKGSRAMSFE
ncbi:hypothetical protein ACP70R_002790 [Stipagrostis hirtigluma subsp. patula]